MTAWNICIRELLRKTQTIFYIFPTFASGRRILWDAINNDGFRILDYLPMDLIESRNEQQMRIRLINGSVFQIIGSDSYNNTLVGTNPAGVVFSEFAISDPMAYSFIRPILSANEGWCMICSCVSPETLVIGTHGFKRIKDMSSCRDEYSDLNEQVYGLSGFHNAEQFYYGGKQKTLKIELVSGYSLECTHIHPIWNGVGWIKAGDLKEGDLIPIQYGQNVWGQGCDVLNQFCFKRDGNRHYNELNLDFDSHDFFYFLGLFHADGNYNKSNVCVTKKKDPEIISFLRDLGFRTRPDGMHHEFSSRELCAILEFMGFKHGARNKTFPEILFQCTKEQMVAFLQGLFDGDGCSASGKGKRGYVKLTSTCLPFMKDLQVILLNFGICSSVRSEYKAPTKKVKVFSTIYNLEITGYFAHVFYRDIGFRLERKQKNWDKVPARCAEESGNIYPVDVSRLSDCILPQKLVTNPSRMNRRTIKKLIDINPHNKYLPLLLSENFFYSPIKSITESESDVYDFVIPETHSFFSNGLISHNTPRGKNFMWELYEVAKNSPHWFVSKLTVDETKHIPIEEILKERENGEMSEDLQMQEYWTSFEKGVEGSYYTKYLDRARLAGQISNVPWDSSLPVHTAWDLGVRDTTAIIFFQTSGKSIRIIDSYEKNKEGLEHYISYLKTKPYIYGKHIGPHDIRVRELGSGITRWEKARSLGVRFEIADQISVEDGIEAVRSTFSRLWIDDRNCKNLIKAIENYRQEYDSKKGVYKPRPLHDKASNFCDSLRYLCISIDKTADGLSAKELEKNYHEAMWGTQGSMPSIFRDDTRMY